MSLENKTPEGEKKEDIQSDPELEELEDGDEVEEDSELEDEVESQIKSQPPEPLKKKVVNKVKNSE